MHKSHTLFFIDSEPEYIRPLQAELRFGIARATIYNMMADGVIETRVLRRPGKTKGLRLISTSSLRRYIQSCPSK